MENLKQVYIRLLKTLKTANIGRRVGGNLLVISGSVIVWEGSIPS